MKQVFIFVETSVKTWYDDEEKAEGKVTHARVITGYNSTGIFFHDPWDGPNIFLNYSSLLSLAVIIATRRSNEQNEVSHSVYF